MPVADRRRMALRKPIDREQADVWVVEHVFPFLRSIGGDGSTYAHHMKDARFTIPTPALLSKVVDMLDHVPMEGVRT